ncbi:actinia tenebrosa protease inhibitors-like isoform X2 [Mercenaria mercenaria]|uniref:actinia tenebrosa protease inhibitors-like isoform X2 n=1 Tax=Mercenaria mercenaria TaxID=6596 RepID=UPI00234E5A3B|nr:actinia tenebrosa protease inhibitors-like isoform X2 [Mercenaria mercenaria]
MLINCALFGFTFMLTALLPKANDIDTCSGFCGGIAGIPCPVGLTCKLMGKFPDAGGKCCIDESIPISACLLPKKPGPCKAAIPRYFYNTDTCQCEPFTWGGCRPNDNNFLNLVHCQALCEKPMKNNAVCELPKKISGHCNLPSAQGPCNGHFQRFFFNIQTCQCEEFIYGGCGGNENRYETLQECRAVCGSSIMCPVCNLPSVKGPCEEKLDRWYFDVAECKCKKFRYGGCGGNMNRFLSRKDCEGSCGTFPCPVCSEPMKVGPCKMAIDRFFYDPLANKCKEFTWGGCLPNGNNFRNKRLCNNVCKNFVCSLPAKAGPCEAAIERYYYDAATGKCQMFLWGGCDSNGNNFRSLKACKRNCMQEE